MGTYFFREIRSTGLVHNFVDHSCTNTFFFFPARKQNTSLVDVLKWWQKFSVKWVVKWSFWQQQRCRFLLGPFPNENSFSLVFTTILSTFLQNYHFFEHKFHIQKMLCGDRAQQKNDKSRKNHPKIKTKARFVQPRGRLAARCARGTIHYLLTLMKVGGALRARQNSLFVDLDEGWRRAPRDAKIIICYSFDEGPRKACS